jgi:hypothetical protein
MHTEGQTRLSIQFYSMDRLSNARPEIQDSTALRGVTLLPQIEIYCFT